MFRAFSDQFPDVGVTESRMVMTIDGDRIERFLFLELYCDDEGCDCRRVIVRVLSVSETPAGPAHELASLSFGWEPAQFYRDWASFPLGARDIEEMKGPALQRLAPQSARANEMLRQFRSLLEDRAYVDRIRRHYRMFRETIDQEAGASPSGPRLNRAQRRARRRRPGLRAHVR
jgi:hypothetical protein